MTGRLLILGLLALTVRAAESSVPWELRCGDQVRRGDLAVNESVQAVTVAPGQRVVRRLGDVAPLPLVARHMYRVTARLRRDARMRVTIAIPEAPTILALPPGEFLVPPVWEDVRVFMVVPPDLGDWHLDMVVTNAADGMPEGSAGLAGLVLDDLGEVRDLPQPRRIGAWDRVELNERLVTLPRVVHDGGSGIYRVRLTITAPAAYQGRILLEMGDEPRLHWWRSSTQTAVYDAEAGTLSGEWLFYVGDRRFLHQWLRLGQPVTDPPAVLTEIALDQLAAEPSGAAAFGIQTYPHQ